MYVCSSGMYVCTHASLHMCVHLCVHACVCVCVCACVHVCVCVCTYMQHALTSTLGRGMYILFSNLLQRACSRVKRGTWSEHPHIPSHPPQLHTITSSHHPSYTPSSHPPQLHTIIPSHHHTTPPTHPLHIHSTRSKHPHKYCTFAALTSFHTALSSAELTI